MRQNFEPRQRLLFSLAVLIFFAAVNPPYADDSLKAKKPFVPTTQYELRTIAGWSVRVNKDLLRGKHAATGKRAIALLQTKLSEIRRLLPANAVKKLARVTFWLGVNDYAMPNPTYHPSRDWLVENGWNPDKAQCIDIGNASILLQWIKDQPMLLLHELSHAYHDQVLGYDNAEVKRVYANALKSKKYERVKNISGAVLRAYALNDAEEFFAEASEAYFGVNDYQPFTRDELRKFDPKTYRVVEKMWNQ